MSEPRRIDKPETGYWLVRLGRKRPWVPAAICFVHTRCEPDRPTNLMPERSPFLVGYIAGRIVDPSEVWERKGKPITKEMYEYELRDAAWARDFAPSEPKAQPERAIDLSALPPITP